MDRFHRDLIKKGLKQISSEGLLRILKAKRMLLNGNIYNSHSKYG
jgi:hypothetical protein